MIEHNDMFINGAWDASSASAVPAIVNPVAEEMTAHISRIVGDVDRSSRAVATSMTAASTGNSAFGHPREWARVSVDEFGAPIQRRINGVSFGVVREEIQMHRRDFMKALGAGAALSSLQFTRAIAQNTGVIRMIVPLPAGSSNDTSTRLIAQGLEPILGQAVIVENKAGASGVIGTSEVIRAKPDGLTILAGSLSPLAANMAFVKNLPYDPRKDLAAVAGSTLTNHVLVVAPNSPVKTFADFIAYAKERPGKVTIGYSTAIVQLQIVTLNKMAGIDLLPVPYKGAPESVTDVMAGVIDATMANPGPTIGFEKSGKLRPLAVTSLKRNSNTPEWPAISETLPGFDFPSWNAFAAPLKTPRDVIDRLSNAIAKAQKDPTVIQRLSSEATVPLIMNPEETAAYIAAETEKYVKLGREAGIEPA